MAQQKILICIDWFLPGFKAGGPIQSIHNMVIRLKNDFDFYIITSNKDFGDEEPYKNIDFNVWLQKREYTIMYLDPAHQTLKFYRELLKNERFDAIYLNSLFSLKFSLFPQWASRSLNIKKVLAPRGMLGAGALKIKRTKKKLFLLFFKALGFHKKLLWHATSELEAQEIIRNFDGNLRIVIAPNLASKMGPLKTKRKRINHLKVFFLSRISIKKRLKEALIFLGGVDPEIHINFTIIGPVSESNYWMECQNIIETMPKNIKVNYVGSVPNHQLGKLLQEQHLLLLPTMHENYGHVIVESWQNGCPVLISDQTPWRNLEKFRVGYDVSINLKEKYINIINNFSKMNEETYNYWSISSYNYAKKFIENPNHVESTKQLFT